jgi:hypothetical protein
MGSTLLKGKGVRFCSAGRGARREGANVMRDLTYLELQAVSGGAVTGQTVVNEKSGKEAVVIR